MLQKPYIIRGDNWCESCVIKVAYGNKYIIAKCKSQPATLKNIEDSLNAFIRGGKNNPSSIYFHLFNYVKSHPDNKFKVDILLESDNGYLLLKKEQQELDKGKDNTNFLNNQLQAYIPAYNEERGMFGWLTKNNVLNFKKWLKTSKKAKKTSV